MASPIRGETLGDVLFDLGEKVATACTNHCDSESPGSQSTCRFLKQPAEKRVAATTHCSNGIKKGATRGRTG
jgi:hypothetical protein